MGCHFKALGDDSRRKILTILGNNGSSSSGEIAKNFKISQPTISNHLRILKEAGLVNEKKVKQSRIYSLNKEKVNKVINTLHSIMSSNGESSALDLD
ncbi:MAG: metalloregulator ArsR/SmtB family transcription factor [Thermodesulfobacteriota bacterium]